MTRTDYLESVLKTMTVGDELTIVFKPFRGWYLCGESRWIGDDGEDWIGANWREAEKEMRCLYRQAA
jgi:hypothetical protein